MYGGEKDLIVMVFALVNLAVAQTPRGLRQVISTMRKAHAKNPDALRALDSLETMAFPERSEGGQANDN